MQGRIQILRDAPGEEGFILAYLQVAQPRLSGCNETFTVSLMLGRQSIFPR